MGLIQRGKIYHIDMVVNGQRIRKSTETSDKNLAENILSKIRTQIVEGKYFPKPPGERKLFCEMMERFIEEHQRDLSKNSKIAYGSALKHLLPVFAETPLIKITPGKIMTFQQKRLKEDAAPATISIEIALMSKAFNTAIKWGWLDTNPCSKIEKLKINNKRVRYFKEGEAEKLYAVLPQWLKAIVTIARFTGLRISNILGLTWDDVNMFSKTIIIGKTKNGEPLGLPMTNTVYETFKSLSKVRRINTSFIFAGQNGKPVSQSKVGKHFRKARKTAGIENFRFHDLRHDFCSNLVQRGVDLYTVAALAGHKDIKTTQRYAHLSPEKLRKDIAVLDEPMTQNSHNGKTKQISNNPSN